MINSGQCETLVGLNSDHEEAYIRLLLHAANFIVGSCGFGLESRYIPVHNLAHVLIPHISNALIGFHGLTGCDSNSALSGLGKKNGINVYASKDCQHIEPSAAWSRH